MRRLPAVPPHLFIAFWFLINIVPAALAELTSDEGYYWFLSNNLQWGYYDHPPMLALLVATGTSILSGELGVRLLNVIVTTLALVLLFRMLPDDPKQRWWAYLLLLSTPLLSYLSILIIPDGPLLLFSLLFLYGYRRFLERDDAASILLMGVAMGLMAYSKYHGILVVFLTVLSNPKLLRSKAFYLACAFALVMFLPHLWWQFQHDFVTFRYHLTGRSRPFTPAFLIDYVGQQLFAVGPVLLIVPFVVRVRDPFQRALKFVAVGTLLFFLATTLRGMVHIHWTSIALYPAILLAVPYYAQRSGRLAIAMLAPFLILGILMRVYVVYQFIPTNHQGIDFYHDRDLWAQDIHALAGSDPVLFPREFRQAPLYTFYSGEMGVALFPGDERQTQYELWQYEDSLQARAVTWVQDIPMGGDTLHTRMGQTIRYVRIPLFASYYNLRLTDELPDTVSAAQDSVAVRVTLHNHRETAVTFPPNHVGGVPRLQAHVRGSSGIQQIELRSFTPGDSVPAEGSKAYDTVMPVSSLPTGSYTVRFSIDAHPHGSAFVSPVHDLQIIE